MHVCKFPLDVLITSGFHDVYLIIYIIEGHWTERFIRDILVKQENTAALAGQRGKPHTIQVGQIAKNLVSIFRNSHGTLK